RHGARFAHRQQRPLLGQGGRTGGLGGGVRRGRDRRTAGGRSRDGQGGRGRGVLALHRTAPGQRQDRDAVGPAPGRAGCVLATARAGGRDHPGVRGEQPRGGGGRGGRHPGGDPVGAV